MTAPQTVLLVEDDPSDVLLMQEVLRGGRGLIELKVVSDGEAALEFLRGRGRYAGARTPSLVLLDWRLPKLSGAEVLRAARADAALGLIPILILTTSASERDVRQAYGLGANAFLTKPAGLDGLRALMALIESFWLSAVVLPTAPMKGELPANNPH